MVHYVGSDPIKLGKRLQRVIASESLWSSSLFQIYLIEKENFECKALPLEVTHMAADVARVDDFIVYYKRNTLNYSYYSQLLGKKKRGEDTFLAECNFT